MDSYVGRPRHNKGIHNEKRHSLVQRRDKITLEIAKHANADDKFTELMQDIVKISGNAYSRFLLSNAEGKRRIVNFIFLTLKLRGKN